jgi:hypothetical protein
MNLEEYQQHLKRMEEDEIYKQNWIKEEEIKRKQRFLDLLPFRHPGEIPELPNVSEEEWKGFYVPTLIKKGAIPKCNLIDGRWYYGDHRRCYFAKWNEKENHFEYVRYKFGYFWDFCNHFEDDDGFALFVPIRKATIEEQQNELKNIK